MKFYEFNNYEYYGLIVAKDMEYAISGYIENISELYDDEIALCPNEITIEEALDRYTKGNIENCETLEEKVDDFYKTINRFEDCFNKKKTPYLLLLIDGNLI